MKFTEEQEKKLLDLIGGYTRESLGPIVKECVEEHLRDSGASQNDNGSLAVADAIKDLAASNRVDEPPEKGQIATRLIISLASSKGDPEKASKFAKNRWGEDSDVAKALEVGGATAGGFIVPPNYSADMIEMLIPRVIARSMGATTMPLVNGSLQVPKQTAGSSAQYIGESQDIPESQPVFGMLQMSAKKLAALVPVSNDLLRYSSPSADQIVRDDAVRAMSQQEDVTFIRGAGTEFSPKGVRNWAPAANLLNVNATVNLANVTVDLGTLVLALLNANVAMTRPGWMFAPRTWNYLMNVRDTNGNFAFRPEMLRGTLWGFPFKMTTNIPINLAVTGTDESEVYLVDWADVIIADAMSLTIDASTEASYMSGGSLVSAFSVDQTVVRVISEHDLGVRHEESIAVLIDVDWT